MTPELLVSYTTILASGLLSVAFLATVYRVVVGPTLPDRIIALDMLVGIAIGFIAVIAIRTGFNLYVDIAIALGLVGFLATVAFARFVLSRGPDGKRRSSTPLDGEKTPDMSTKASDIELARTGAANRKATRQGAETDGLDYRCSGGCSDDVGRCLFADRRNWHQQAARPLYAHARSFEGGHCRLGTAASGCRHPLHGAFNSGAIFGGFSFLCSDSTRFGTSSCNGGA